MKKIIGLTLIELMLALALSILLLDGLYSVFIFSEKIFQAQVDFIHIQENMRILSEIIKIDIQHAKSGSIMPFHSREMKKLTDGLSIKRKCSYFLAATGRHHQDGTIVYALYKKLFAQPITEIVDEVEEMNIKYSIFENGMLVEKKEEDIGNWQNVVGVSLAFLLRDQAIKRREFIYVAIMPLTKKEDLP